jgi:hypothetical protein
VEAATCQLSGKQTDVWCIAHNWHHIATTTLLQLRKACMIDVCLLLSSELLTLSWL